MYIVFLIGLKGKLSEVHKVKADNTYIVFDTCEKVLEEVSGSLILEYIDIYGNDNINVFLDKLVAKYPFDDRGNIALIDEGKFAYITDKEKRMQYTWYNNKAYTLYTPYMWTVRIDRFDSVDSGISFGDFMLKRVKDML